MHHSDGNYPNDPVGGCINPASGLPIIEDTMIDIAGNPYGTDSLDHLRHGLDTDWGSGTDMFSGNSMFGEDW